MISLSLYVTKICAWNTPTSQVNMTEHYIPVNGATLFCHSIGHGKPLVVIHGGPGLTHDYLFLELSQLAKDHLVIFYDQRACGKSTGSIHPDSICLETYINDLEALRQYFHLEKISLLGHSWGGFLAMQYAISQPNFVDKLILSNSVPGSSNEFNLFIDEFHKVMVPYQNELKEIETSNEFINGDPKAGENYYRVIFKAYCHLPKTADLLNLKMSSEAFLNGLKVSRIFEDNVLLKPFDIHNSLKKLKIPTLIIHGDSDPVPESCANNLHHSIGNSKYVLMKNCGHFSYVEHPQIFFKSVNEFLNHTK